MPPRRIVVVGASLAGLRAAEALRAHEFSGDLTIVGAEQHPPYSRPPLSKQLLSGAQEPADCALRHADLGADWRLGTRATALDLERRRVTLDSGDALAFDGLIIATGASARPWPGSPPPRLAGILSLRTLDDALALRSAVAERPRVAVLGAGFIGCEVAATLRRLGLAVTLIDVAPLPMGPLGPEIGALCAELHREQGVDLRMSTTVDAFEGSGRIEAIRLAGGERVPADLVLIATGAVPNVGWLRDSGLRLAPGVVCAATCEAVGAHDVFCAGDLAQFPHPLADDELVRVEHWSNAAEQGAAAAANLLAKPSERLPYAPVPSFWSDQYGVKIQSVGFPACGGRAQLIEGAVDERRFVAAFERDGRLVGAIAFNSPRRIPHYRQWVVEQRTLDGIREELGAAPTHPSGATK